MARSTLDRSARVNRNAVMAAIADGCTYQEAASRAGVQVSTVARYMQDPEFTHALNGLRATIASTNATALNARCLDAIERLHSLMNDPRSTQSVQAKAAATLLAEARAWKDTEIEQRIVELEEQTSRATLRAL